MTDIQPHIQEAQRNTKQDKFQRKATLGISYSRERQRKNLQQNQGRKKHITIKEQRWNFVDFLLETTDARKEWTEILLKK
jgi:hypothetical protein